MDIPTLLRLKREHDPLFLVPLGNKEFLEEQSIANVEEMDWWDKYVFKGKDVYLVPAKHFSMRGLCDRNTTLWGGFVIITNGGPVYFAGDTGYGKHFEMIRRKFGPMRFSMLPIGAYRPRWFMKPVHTSPAEAALAHIDLDSRRSMGIHFGTFIQADDGRIEPIIDLKEAMIDMDIEFSSFILPRHGKGVMIDPLMEKEEISQSGK
jgi:L-ascorbate metabolism protein UlaG (beta-lactamase superfamily)